MSEKITIHLTGGTENYEREVDTFDPDEPQYRSLSETEQEVYHYSGRDQNGDPVFELQGFAAQQYPKINTQE